MYGLDEQVELRNPSAPKKILSLGFFLENLSRPATIKETNINRLLVGGSNEMSSDAELLLKYQLERSSETFSPIVHRHGRMVLATCLRRLGNMHDAEDATQESFAVLARKATEIKGSLSGWLHAVALHTANQMVRTRVRRLRREKELANMNRRIGSYQLEEGDWKEELDSALVELPEELREAVILRYLEGLKHEEAASRIGCPVSTTAWRSDQGLHRLRSIMARRGVMLSVGGLAALLLGQAEAMAAVSSTALTALTATSVGASASAGAGLLGKLAVLKAPWAAALGATVMAAGIATSVALWGGSANPPPGPAAVYTQPAAVFDSGKKGVRGHNFALNDRWLASGNSDRTIQLWDVINARPGFTLGGNVDDAAITLAFSPRQSILATAGDAGVVKLWDLEARQELAALPAQPRATQINSLAFSADGKLLASGGWDSSIIVFDVDKRQPLHTLPRAHDDGVMVLRFSPDGKLLASASWDGVIKVWETASGKALQTLTAHPGGVWIGLDFSADGRLASAGPDHSVKIWDWAAGTVTTNLQGHAGPVYSVCWSPDGKFMASGSQDEKAKLWDAQTGRLLATYESGDQVLQVQFTPDGKFLVTAGWHTPLQLWTVVAQPSGER
jgi:RNA polymerase sigma factor (sigma-70 family)